MEGSDFITSQPSCFQIKTPFRRGKMLYYAGQEEKKGEALENPVLAVVLS